MPLADSTARRRQLASGTCASRLEFSVVTSEASELRKIDTSSLILAVSAQMHGERAKESEVVVDSTVQEKNVSYPLDTKQYRKIITRCWKLADRSAVRLRRRYRKEVRGCIMAQRWRKDPRKRKAARRGHRRLRTIAGALIGELERKLPAALREEQGENFTLYRRVLAQKAQDTDKDLLFARAAHLLRGQRQGAQEIRIWNQSLCGDDQNPRRHRGSRGP